MGVPGKVFLVLLAGGAGMRMGKNKLALAFGGNTPLRRCYEAFLACRFPLERAAIAASPENMGEALALAAADPRITVTDGGATRGASVRNALLALRAAGAGEGVVAIHDGARCLMPAGVADAAIAGAMEFGSGIAAVPVRDTVRNEAGTIIPRDGLFQMQTPQAFDFSRIFAAYEAAEEKGFSATDDCAVYMEAGYTPHFTQGSIMNQKLTYREDVPFFQAVCGNAPRVGFGEDTHALVEGRRLVLGGVDIPCEKGLLGHSDADALAHAVMDALLGAAALGDIGQHFPDTDPCYAGADSIELLRQTVALLSAHGFSPYNVDATVVAERPKLAPHIPAMRENLANALGIPVGQVSVKATTSEKMNDEGAGKCITARALCMLLSNP